MDLINKKCKPCEGGVAPLTPGESEKLLKKIPAWILSNDNKFISREFSLKNFNEGIDFIVSVGKIAEEDGHHPDINLHDYKIVKISLWTHAINGLSENDFIVAAKIDVIGK